MDSQQEPTEPIETKQEARKRPRSSREIGESEEWLFTALQSVGDAIIATDAVGSIVFMNQVAVNLTGWSEEEAQGVDCHEVFHIVNESTRLETESPVTKVIRDGVISGLANHTILIARDGTEHNIDDSGSPISDKAGLLTGVVLIFRDVSERRKSEQTRQEQQEILQTLFDHIPVIVTFLDDKGQFKWVNQEWTRLIGWSLEEMQEKKRLETFYPPILPVLLENPSLETLKAVASPLEDPAPGWRDFTLTTKDGHDFDLSWATVMLSNGTSIGIGQDITRRKQRETLALQHTGEVETRNRRLEQAIRETDHRVKNNLQSISTLLDLRLMGHPMTIPVKDLTQVRMHIVTLASLHDMLVADVKDAVAAPVISAKAALEKMVPMLQKLVGEQRISWTADEVYLPVKQGMSLAVLVNELVTNAVKHGGQRVELRLALQEKEVSLEVSDDGPGFAEAFNPKTAAHYGLELIETVGRYDLGGKTVYENRPEGGARVRVTFPLPVMQEALAS